MFFNDELVMIHKGGSDGFVPNKRQAHGKRRVWLSPARLPLSSLALLVERRRQTSGDAHHLLPPHQGQAPHNAPCILSVELNKCHYVFACIRRTANHTLIAKTIDHMQILMLDVHQNSSSAED